MPKFDDPFHPVLPHRHTEPQPFSFEERMKETIAKKEKKIQMTLEEEAKVCILAVVVHISHAAVKMSEIRSYSEF